MDNLVHCWSHWIRQRKRGDQGVRFLWWRDIHHAVYCSIIDMKSTPSGGSTTWFSACVYFLYFLCMKWSQSSLCFSVIRLDFIRLSSKLGVKWVRSGPARPSWISLFLSLSLSLYAGSVPALLCSVEVVALNGSEAMHSVWVPERDI